MKLLDCGCGPGSITLELAEVVHPGNVVGIDGDTRRIEVSERLASEGGITNVRFQMADVYDLPFSAVIWCEAIGRKQAQPAQDHTVALPGLTATASHHRQSFTWKSAAAGPCSRVRSFGWRLRHKEKALALRDALG